MGFALNGWQLSGIYRYQTGAPYNVGVNIANLSGFGLTGTDQVEGARVVVLKNPGSGNNGSNSSDAPYQQLDASAFTGAAVGSTGYESGRNFLRVAALNSWDLALSKEFQIKEGVKFEIRLDAFNALNHTQFDGVFNTLNLRGFVAATAATATTPATPARIDLTPTNLASQTGNRTGFGAVSSTRLPRNMQLSARFQF